MKAEPSLPVSVPAEKPSAISLERWADFLGAVGVFAPLLVATIVHFLTPLGSGSYKGVAITGVAIGLAVHLATGTSRPTRVVGFVAAGTILSWLLWLALLPSTATGLATIGFFWIIPWTVIIRRAEAAAEARGREELAEAESQEAESD